MNSSRRPSRASAAAMSAARAAAATTRVQRRLWAASQDFNIGDHYLRTVNTTSWKPCLAYVEAQAQVRRKEAVFSQGSQLWQRNFFSKRAP
eukprot:5235251-Pyramimonas_sp.AAC.1